MSSSEPIKTLAVAYKKEITKQFWKQNAKIIAVSASIATLLLVAAVVAFVKGHAGWGSTLLTLDAIVTAPVVAWLAFQWRLTSGVAKVFEAAVTKKSA